MARKSLRGFPDTPEGRVEATNFAEQLAEDKNAQKEQAAEVGQTILTIVSATVDVDGPYFGHTMEMIETHVDHQSEGLAEEL